ncbi:MAG: DUF1501 domain-containing protein [Actinobacteria bacterium]|nr:DUF1501 domain-containing protein [Actinomycetota bacterium]
MHLDGCTRRQFLSRSASLAVAGSAMPFALNLAAMGEAAAFSAVDYKALVCVFLFGGNDNASTVIPYDTTSYGKYIGIRGPSTGSTFVVPRADLAASLLKPSTALGEGRQYALHPNMAKLAALFNQGKAAVQLNVGPLVMPITRAQFNSGNNVLYPLPPKLFSHNDQQSVWQSSAAEGATVGWGGLIGDLALSSNGTGSVFTCTSVTGNTVFLAGRSAGQYQCSTAGPIAIGASKNGFFGNASRQIFNDLIQKSSADILEDEYAKVVRRSIDSEKVMSSALGAVSVATAFPETNLGRQLAMVARQIAARNSLGLKRQVFMVSMGGFDLHDELPAKQPGLLREVSDAIAAFYEATVELGVAGNVTTFTASDFGRAMTPNGDGADHGWGSHHFVVGGSVRGGAFYGTPPPVSVGDTSSPDDQWHVGQGRLLPTTSVDQFAATMAQWLGVADTELDGLLPNLKNFGAGAALAGYPRNLGFLS